MKALGVVHFKGNWTNKKPKIKTLVYTAFILPFQNIPPTVDSH